MAVTWLDRPMRGVSSWLDDGPMRRLGIRNTMRLAKAYNGLTRGRYLRYRRQQCRDRLDDLLAANGPNDGPTITMEDGWALDESHSLPHLDRLLDDAQEVIAERGRQAEKDGRYRAFFRNIITVEDLERWPSFLDFICSSPVISTASRHLGLIPALSRTIPTGVRFTESWVGHDAEADGPPRDSQLFHTDPYESPLVYVIVLLHDVNMRQGPFCFYPASTSAKIAKALNYQSRGQPYRLTDEAIYGVANESERIDLCYPKGTVLFIDSSTCMHYGSRHAFDPRYQLMYGLVSPVRADFSETNMTPDPYAPKPGDSDLRMMLLDMYYLGEARNGSSAAVSS